MTANFEDTSELNATRVWRTSTAEAEGVDPAGIRSLIEEFDTDETQDPHAIVIVRHGAVIASAQWAPYAVRRPQLLYSLSKSFTSSAAGFAVAEGLLDLDTPAADYFPEYADSVADASRGILVRHLASMATGHLNDMFPAFEVDPQHPIRAFFSMPPEREPGTVFAYNQLATYTLGAIIQRRSGQRLSEYLRPRLLEPLGISPIGWQQQPADVELGFSGLFAPAEAVAKLGQLYLNRGVWNGERLLSDKWIREATSVQVANAAPGGLTAASSDWEQGYGFQFWMSRQGFRGDGAFGQYCLVLPEHDAVVAITSQTIDMQDALNRVWKHLLPAFGSVPLRPQGGADLHDVVREIGFPTLPGSLDDLALDAAGEYARADDDESVGEFEALAAATLQRDDGPGGSWRLTLNEGGPGAAAVGAPGGTAGGIVGAGEWVTTEADASGSLRVPVALRGGIVSDGTVRVDVAFVDTPHRLTLTFDPASRIVTPRWRSRPLRLVSMRELRAVRPGETIAIQE
ncbi:MAG TPA: serine hydrolase [Humibacter sp.]|nr:serine hydrolase [Humibacter sp.]